MRKKLFERLEGGLKEAIAHERGDLALKVIRIDIPKPPREYEPEDIRELRTRLHMSQTQFALLLSVSKKTVQGWEQGLRRPTSSAARLLQFIEKPELLEQTVG